MVLSSRFAYIWMFFTTLSFSKPWECVATNSDVEDNLERDLRPTRLASTNTYSELFKDYKFIKKKFDEVKEKCPASMKKDADAGKNDPDVFRNASQLITSKGYPCEEHTVTTEDGYILTLHRIPHGKLTSSGVKPVVYMQHGLLTSSTNFLINSANDSLGFMLADRGYDVWLGNVRGNTYSRKHTTLNPDKDHLYWKFSFDEMAKYDLPAMLQYVLRYTKQQELFYVGHSQGTLIGFAEFSRNKELSRKIKAFFALAPVTTVGELRSPIRLLTPFASTIKIFYELFYPGEFLPSSRHMKWLANNLCSESLAFVCENILFLIAGFDCAQLNITRVPVYLAHTPAGTSAQNMLHYAQEVKSQKFQMYNYGEKENVKVYGQAKAPLYNLTGFDVPLALYWGGEDWLADPEDVKILIKQLKPNVIIENKYIATYDHLDFIWGLNAHKLVYSGLLDLMDKLRVN